MSEDKDKRMSRYEKKDQDKTNEIETTKKEEQETPEEEHHKLLDSKPKKVFFAIILFLIIICIYASTFGVSIIDVKESKVESNLLPDSFHGLKIVHFSDLHYGTSINKKQLDRVIKKINQINPDIIFFTGDLVDKNIVITDTIKQEIITSLNQLNKDTYKYAIYGNEDDNTYKEIIESTNFTLLDNESTLLYYKDITPIMITGFNSNTKPNYTILTNNIDDVDTSSLYKVVLIHEPDTIDNFIDYNPNLVLSGHSLGGLINLPLIKSLFLPANGKKYYKDYYNINDINFYISNGLGTTGIKARLNNHPSINFYRLYKTEEVLNS